MNLDGDLNQLGTHDISLIKKHVMNFTENDWAEEDFRQKKFEVHRDTQTIPLLFNDDSAKLTPILLPRYSGFANILAPLFQQMGCYFNNPDKSQVSSTGGYPVSVLFVKLLPGGKITPHMDSGFSLTHSHRVHIPLLTNDETHFTVGESTVNMLEGEIWEINNRRLHSVSNNSEAERIHLIIDWRVPDQSCCCGTRIHPGTPCTPDNCESGPYLCNCFAHQ